MFFSWLRNIRFYILVSSFILSVVILPFDFSDGINFISIEQVTRAYGLVSIVFLYFALLPSPLLHTFPAFPYSKKIIFSRRAVGVASFYFALLHSILSFVGQLGGISGLWFLNNSYLFAIGIGIIALFIMFIMAITSFDFVIKKVTFSKWKFIHRFIYIGSVFILLHAIILGQYFNNPQLLSTRIIYISLFLLLLLEAVRFDTYLRKKIKIQNHYGISVVLTSALIASLITLSFIPTNTSLLQSLNIHAAHIQLAKDILQNQFSTSTIPGLQGDRTLRYTVSMITPDSVEPNQDVTIRFKIYNASTGSQQGLFKILYAKPMHLIIVNDELTYFQHIHPTQDGYDFVVTTQFPTTDVYRLYIEFQPFGAIEQQMGFTLPVGDNVKPVFPQQPVDINMTKRFGNYTVTLTTYGQLSAQDMAIGQQKLTFTLKDAKTGKPLTNLQPYLAAFGHLTLINEGTYDYLHVHPTTIIPPKLTDRSGPNVDFLPIGIYGPIKPGIYRVFGEFNPDGNLFTADFTVKVN